MLCRTDNRASCKIRAVTRFLHAKNMSAAEIIAKHAWFMAKM
jgi:hypothetical protein